jgi:hypothetical protein
LSSRVDSLGNARDESDPYYVEHVLMLVLGLRRRELLGLTWQDVHVDARTALIYLASAEGLPGVCEATVLRRYVGRQ